MLSDVFYSIYSHFLVKYPSRGKIFRSFLGGRLESFSLQTQFSALENNLLEYGGIFVAFLSF